MKIDMRQKIEKKDVVVIVASALGGFLIVLICGLIAGKDLDLATVLLVGLLLGAPGGACGGVLACLLPRKFILLPTSFREYTNAELRAYLIGGTIYAGLIGFSTFGGRQYEWWRWLARLFCVVWLAGVWYRALREFRRRRQEGTL